MSQFVTDDMRQMAKPDQYGRSVAFAVYSRRGQGREAVTRNLRLVQAEALAVYLASTGETVHVSLDTCG
jgi:hypothetical protein